jgi:hypothetical protein
MNIRQNPGPNDDDDDIYLNKNGGVRKYILHTDQPKIHKYKKMSMIKIIIDK